MGLEARVFGAISSLLIGVWTIVIVVILDLGAPRVGTNLTGTSAYDWMLQRFEIGGAKSSVCP